jgi:hypothetical protein
MTSIGGQELLNEFGSAIDVAVAWIKGEIKYFESSVTNVVGPIEIAAAHARLDLIAKGVIDG